MKKLLLLTLGLALLAAPALAVVPTTNMGNANYSMTVNDQRVVTGTPLTAARTLTLPSAGGTCIGQLCPAQAFEFIDVSGSVTSTITVTITPQTNETINNSTNTFVVSAAFSRVVMVPTSGSNWALAFVPGNVQGTATNDSAPAGSVGEVISATVLSPASAIQIANTPITVAQALLSAGDWDCRGNVGLSPSTQTALTVFKAWVSSLSNTEPVGTENPNISLVGWQTAVTSATNQFLGVPPARISLASAASVFLGDNINSTASVSINSFGNLTCRRAR